jgi:hypothetical protein
MELALLGRCIRLRMFVYGDQSHASIQSPVNTWIAVPARETCDATRALARARPRAWAQAQQAEWTWEEENITLYKHFQYGAVQCTILAGRCVPRTPLRAEDGTV